MSVHNTAPFSGTQVAAALTERAKKRLRIAAALLRGQGMRFDVPRDSFYAHALQSIEELPIERRTHLRSLVDWVEQYEAAELDRKDRQGRS